MERDDVKSHGTICSRTQGEERPRVRTSASPGGRRTGKTILLSHLAPEPPRGRRSLSTEHRFTSRTCPLFTVELRADESRSAVDLPKLTSLVARACVRAPLLACGAKLPLEPATRSREDPQRHCRSRRRVEQQVGRSAGTRARTLARPVLHPRAFSAAPDAASPS